MPKAIEARVDEFFADGEQPNDEWVRALLSSLTAALKQATRSSSHNLWTLLVVWAISTAVYGGILSGGEFASFTVADSKKLLIIAPLVLAYLGYRLMLWANVEVVLARAILQIYKKALPALHKGGLDLLLLLEGGTAFTAQLVLVPDFERKVHKSIYWMWSVTILSGALLSPTLAILHVSYLLWHGDVWAPGWVALSAGIALLVDLRSTLFVYSAWRAA